MWRVPCQPPDVQQDSYSDRQSNARNLQARGARFSILE
jgi:hypothetical protein